MEHRIFSEDLKISISEKGAEITSVKSSDGLEYIWQAKEELWPRHAPVLFPIVGKLKDNTYNYKGKSYSLGQHGFARDLRFQLSDADESRCSFRLTSSEETLKNYPFRFTFVITYSVTGNVLNTTYYVKNEQQEEMFFSVGAHPGFRCPLVPGEKFEDHYLEFEKENYLQTLLSDGLRSSTTRVLPLQGKKLFLTPSLFNDDALVFENSQVSEISLRSSKSGRGVTIRSENWPYFGIWSKKGCTEFVCLEPWYGIADHEKSHQQLEEKDGIIRLGPGKQFTCSFPANSSPAASKRLSADFVNFLYSKALNPLTSGEICVFLRLLNLSE
jgi:galactose mutarotase-like enzyme